jgi:hypothetical protein
MIRGGLASSTNYTPEQYLTIIINHNLKQSSQAILFGFYYGSIKMKTVFEALSARLQKQPNTQGQLATIGIQSNSLSSLGYYAYNIQSTVISSTLHHLKGCVVAPFSNSDGDIIALSGLNLDSNEWSKVESGIFGFTENTLEEIYIVSSPTEVLLGRQIGIQNIISANTDEDLAPTLSKFSKAYSLVEQEIVGAIKVQLGCSTADFLKSNTYADLRRMLPTENTNRIDFKNLEDNTYSTTIDGICYRIKCLEPKNLSRLKVYIKVNSQKKTEVFYPDELNLQSANKVEAFSEAAACKLNLSGKLIKQDLINIAEALQRLRAKRSSSTYQMTPQQKSEALTFLKGSADLAIVITEATPEIDSTIAQFLYLISLHPNDSKYSISESSNFKNTLVNLFPIEERVAFQNSISSSNDLPLNIPTIASKDSLASLRTRRTEENISQNKKRNELSLLLQNAKRLLKPVSVINPYIDFLLLPTGTPNEIEICNIYLDLIESSTIFHQMQRAHKVINGEKYLIATVEDVLLANELILPLWNSQTTDLHPVTMKIAEHIKTLNKKFTKRELMQASGERESRVRTALDELMSLGYLESKRRAGITSKYTVVIDIATASSKKPTMSTREQLCPS